MTTKRMTAVGAVLAVLFITSACGGGDDPGVVAETLIEGELEEQIAIGALTAECDQPSENAQGVTFDCTATTEGAGTLTFVAEFVEDDEIFVSPTNVITGSEMPAVEAEAAQVLSPEVGVDIDPADIACPTETTVLDAANSLACVITDSATGDRYALTASFADFVREVGFETRNYEIGDLIE